MPTVFSPSDYTSINPDYSTGKGFYTDITAISDLLQIPAFSGSTNPTNAQVGSIIKRVEGIIDDKIKRSFRPIRHETEFHDFHFGRHPADSYYGGYVGFVQLQHMKVRKIVSLQVWQGNSYKELASAQSSITIDENNYGDIHSIILVLPDGTQFTMESSTNVGTSLVDSKFNNRFGSKTTAKEIISLTNEQFPSNTATFTGADNKKSLTEDGATNFNVSDFFYAASDLDNGRKINISSLLMGEDGSDCTLKVSTQQSCTTASGDATLTVADSSKLAVGMTVTGTGISGSITIASITDSTTVELSGTATGSGTNTLTFTTTDTIPNVCEVVPFTDKQNMKRIGSFWKIGNEGRLFFLKDFPYHTNNSVIVSYIAGDKRVPSAIHEAATKLVAAEILRHDDQTILIAETGANITTKEKYDILRKEAMEIIDGKKDIVYIIE
jgi:hypothetical protein|tara:strand:+ start:325 stop:1641 length:1317 start_codon:yes stop_codon:yes gene_type:complete